MKILISVLSYEKGHWADLENAIRSTWGLNVNDGIEIIYYYGDSNKTFMESDKLYTDTEEGVLNVGYKTIKMFNYCYNNFSFDYIFRTNSSSYVNTKELLNFIKNKPLENFYSGIIGSHRGVNFASGSGYFISRDLVQAVISSQKEWDHSFIDDVSLGKLIHEKNIKIYQGERLDCWTISQFKGGYYHYRLKNPKNRSTEVPLMKEIHKRVDQEK